MLYKTTNKCILHKVYYINQTYKLIYTIIYVKKKWSDAIINEHIRGKKLFKWLLTFVGELLHKLNIAYNSYFLSVGVYL